MSEHHGIDYVEFPARDLDKAKSFFSQVFGWHFTDFGDEYTAFNHSSLKGGFYKADKEDRTQNGGALVVIYSQDLAETQQAVEAAGGEIIVPVFEFPGGQRFHFTDLNGNEWAVWSDK